MGLRSERVYADALALLGGLFEPNLAIDKCKQRMVASHSHIATRFDHRPTLANQDRASTHDRPVTALDAESLALRITAVARAADAFLVSHIALYSSVLSAPLRSGTEASSGGGPASAAAAGISSSAPVSAAAAGAARRRRDTVVAVSAGSGAAVSVASGAAAITGSAGAAFLVDLGAGAASATRAVDSPSTRMSVIRRRVSDWRCPVLRR